MSDSENIKKERLDVLEEIERLIGEELPLVNKIRIHTFGKKEINGNIVGLGLYQTGIEEIPKNIGDLKHIEKLSLSNNNLTFLPKSISKIKTLKKIYLNDNEFNKFPYQLLKLNNLEELNLNNNTLASLPQDIEKLYNLRKIYLKKNVIEKLPTSFYNLKKLEIIDLESNNIEYISELIGSLDSLEFLNLSGNSLKLFPESLINLKNLKILKLNDNNLLKLSKKIYDLNKLKELRVDLGEMHSLPISILELMLNEWEKEKFLDLGTVHENSRLKEIQHAYFLNKKPKVKKLIKYMPRIDKIFIHLIQIHSLKGINYPNDNELAYFFFFLKKFWNPRLCEKKKVLSYKGKLFSRVKKKIEELLFLSVSNYNRKPDLIIFPENSIPCNILKSIIRFSNRHNLTIIGGLEHRIINKEFMNIAIIIDNGICGFQVKQTPVMIYNKKIGKKIIEPIDCNKVPNIKIFETHVGRIAIFICKDFLRLYESIPEWVDKNKIDLIVIPSLTKRTDPFHNQLMQTIYKLEEKNLRIIFCNIGEYGKSDLYLKDRKIIFEKVSQEKIKADNIGEKIVMREIDIIEDIKER